MSTRHKCSNSLANWKKAKGFSIARISRIRSPELASETPSEPAARNQGTADPLVYPSQPLSGDPRLALPNRG
jgi:hypothetical protein